MFPNLTPTAQEVCAWYIKDPAPIIYRYKDKCACLKRS